jgi:glucosamine-6-phosphate deaminase
MWSAAVVDTWCHRLATTPRLRMCLPAGHTPTHVYADMARANAEHRASFRRAEVFLLDEYGTLALDDPGRCENMLRRNLLDHVDLPAGQFYSIDTATNDIARICRDYDAQLARGGLDLTMLGIGLNGHLGMNEPGSDPVSITTRRVELHASTIAASARYLNHTNVPTWGITVGLGQLLQSKEIWLLACGANKAEIVHRALSGAVGIDVPATLLRNHPKCIVWLDAAAAALL